MGSILKIRFPKDFESRYAAYKAKTFGQTQEMVAPPDSTVPSPTKRYADAQEPIRIKALGIEVVGRHVIKGTAKRKLNPTEKCLVYFLYYKSIANSDECFMRDRLASEPGFDSGIKKDKYIKNSIAHINKIVRELVVKGKTNIDDFIKYETDRGYHLNPKFML